MIAAVVTMGAMGILASVGLGIAAKKFAVEIDPKIADIDSALPHANCGACGYPGCMGFATAVASGTAPVSGCTAGGASTAAKVAAVMGMSAPEMPEKMIARVYCLGGKSEATDKSEYHGIQDCNAAVLISGGSKSCVHGCLGLASCVRACPFQAMYMSEDGLPVVIDEKCTGCGLCIPPCPKNLIELVPENKDVHIYCRSLDKGSDTKKVCTVGCIACNKCEKVCPYDAITIDSFLARIDYNKCTNCGLCVPVCPTNVITDLIPVRDVAYVHDDCIGCLICKKVCPVDAISGESKTLHVVDPVLCIGCTICADKCPPKVIEMRKPPRGYSASLNKGRGMSGVA
ncbi:MAG: RnfABCDGE type electron transport complex subunit B [Nitrospirae bacterium]|nr:RnfABCDGE type electron transport complex subunit B [Nitrospirota bacterium]